ncbi:MAG: ArsA family ATPase [Planctomycetes bacterium]|nr:ArsA family ATPase [Planctomycetota bacterium]
MKPDHNLPAFLQDDGLRLVLFGGKGGVGKTTCASATALFLAKAAPDRSFLLVSTDPAHSVRDSFAGSSPPANLELMEIDAHKCMEEFRQAHSSHLREIARRGTFLDDEDIEQVLDLSLPGLDEIMAFNEIAKLVDADRYHCIVVDTAPTGHTLRFLELPDIMQEWIATLDAMLAKHRFMAELYRGYYRKDDTDRFLDDMLELVGTVRSVLSDRQRCRFVPVAVAEPVIVLETRRLIDALKKAKIPVTDILLNRVFPEGSNCPVCTRARTQQKEQLRRFCEEFSECRLWRIPIQGAQVEGVEQLGAFWEEIGMLEMPDNEPRPAAAAPIGVAHPPTLPGPEVSLLLFAGKGGVGKTTLASAAAIHLAREYPGKELLLFSTDPAHSLSDCLDVEVGPEETRVLPGLSAIEIDAEAEFQVLKDRYAEEIAGLFDSLAGETWIDFEFDHEVMERFLYLSPPGLDEVMALTRIAELQEKNKYDIVVLDTAPTGHLLRLLEMPELIQDWLKVFFHLFLKYKHIFRLPKVSELLVAMSKRLKFVRSLLTDPHRGRLYAVSILTEMAFEETKDLIAGCSDSGVHVPLLFLNLATPSDGCPLCNAIARKESEVRRRFEGTFDGIHQTVVYRCGELRGINRLGELGAALYGAKVLAGPVHTPVTETAAKK